MGRMGDGIRGIISGSGEAVGTGAVVELNTPETTDRLFPKFARTSMIGVLKVDEKWPIMAA